MDNYPVRCNGCPLIFPNRKRAMAHVRAAGHEITGPGCTRICTECDTTFAKEAEQRAHSLSTGHMKPLPSLAQSAAPMSTLTMEARAEAVVLEVCASDRSCVRRDLVRNCNAESSVRASLLQKQAMRRSHRSLGIAGRAFKIRALTLLRRSADICCVTSEPSLDLF